MRSMKMHLRPTIGSRVLTKDDLYQLAVQIEGCMNSRPLWPMSDQPDDLLPLTPADFVLAKKILPQPMAEDVADVPENKITSFGMRQKMLQQFWRRWREEFLADKQQRTKWLKIEKNIKVGDMVIVRNENLPPAVWALGRVSHVHKASDGIVRTVVVKTATGELVRPIGKLCLLPPETSVDQPINGGE